MPTSVQKLGCCGLERERPLELAVSRITDGA